MSVDHRSHNHRAYDCSFESHHVMDEMISPVDGENRQ